MRKRQEKDLLIVTTKRLIGVSGDWRDNYQPYLNTLLEEGEEVSEMFPMTNRTLYPLLSNPVFSVGIGQDKSFAFWEHNEDAKIFRRHADLRVDVITNVRKIQIAIGRRGVAELGYEMLGAINKILFSGERLLLIEEGCGIPLGTAFQKIEVDSIVLKAYSTTR